MAGRTKDMSTSAAIEVHRQTIKREERTERVQGEFAVTDPMKMKASLLTPKPTASTPHTHISDEQQKEVQANLDALSNRKGVTLSPAERWELPQSSNQEYGFVSAPLVPPSELLEVGHTNCAETTYAAAYYALSGGLTPFSKGDRGTPSGKPGAGKPT